MLSKDLPKAQFFDILKPRFLAKTHLCREAAGCGIPILDLSAFFQPSTRSWSVFVFLSFIRLWIDVCQALWCSFLMSFWVSFSRPSVFASITVSKTTIEFKSTTYRLINAAVYQLPTFCLGLGGEKFGEKLHKYQKSIYAESWGEWCTLWRYSIMDFSHPPIIPQFPQMLEVRPAFGSLFQKLVPGSTVGWLVHSWENGNAASIVWLWYGLQCVIYSVVSCEKCKEGGVWKSVERRGNAFSSFHKLSCKPDISLGSTVQILSRILYEQPQKRQISHEHIWPLLLKLQQFEISKYILAPKVAPSSGLVYDDRNILTKICFKRSLNEGQLKVQWRRQIPISQTEPGSRWKAITKKFTTGKGIDWKVLLVSTL